MSNTDKAKQKLMESMRMTKEGSDKKNAGADTKQNNIPQDEMPIKKKKNNTVTKTTSKDTQKLSVDPYQTVRRVWPD